MKMIETGRVAEVEKYAKEIALELGLTQQLIDRIFTVNLKCFEKKIDDVIGNVILRAQAEHAKALCLYYDIDNSWDSTIYICKNYCQEDNTWITDSRSWVDIGKIRRFSGIYKKS